MVPFPYCRMPTMIPKSPSAEPKISMIKIFTKVEGVWASARAHPAPVIPTATPQKRFESPTLIPAVNIAKAAYKAYRI